MQSLSHGSFHEQPRTVNSNTQKSGPSRTTVLGAVDLAMPLESPDVKIELH